MMHVFVRSRSRGYLGEIPRPEIRREGDRVRVAGNWKGTPPIALDTLEDLVVFAAADGPPAPEEVLLVEGRIDPAGGGRLSKSLVGKSPAAAAVGAPLGFASDSGGS